MTRKIYTTWGAVFEEIDQIGDNLDELCGSGGRGIDFAHWVAERIRQLGRDMEPPEGSVIHDPPKP